MKLKLTIEDGLLRYDLKKLLWGHYKCHTHQLTLDFSVDFKGQVYVEGLRVISKSLLKEKSHVEETK